MTDANVIINLIHIDRMDLLGALPPFSFVVPEEVVKEITESTQAEMIRDAICSGLLQEVRLSSIPELGIYADLVRTLGAGEAACLALAECRGWLVASDEKRAFFREASVRIGQDRIINTAGILLKGIRLNVLTVPQVASGTHALDIKRY